MEKFNQNSFKKNNLKEKISLSLKKVIDTFDCSKQEFNVFDKTVGTNCKVYFIDFLDNHSTKKIVLKIFGEGKNFSVSILEEVKRKILDYQQQLLQCNVFLPFQVNDKDIKIEKINNEYVLMVLEPLYGNSENHFDVISANNIDYIKKIIADDINFILRLVSNISIKLFDDQEFLLLNSGIDSKPDNFVTHQNTSIYIDLYPPLPIENNKVFHFKEVVPYFSSVAWTYLTGTLEGAILRYLRSAEFRLNEPINIQQHYSYVIELLANNISHASFEYIRNQIENFNFNDINRAYERKI
jgi:hypothetical protein